MLNRSDWVRCERDQEKYPGKGTWSKYEGRIGRIVTVNQMDGEYGVRFTNNHSEAITWFLPYELVAVDQPVGAPNIRVQDIDSQG